MTEIVSVSVEAKEPEENNIVEVINSPRRIEEETVLSEAIASDVIVKPKKPKNAPFNTPALLIEKSKYFDKCYLEVVKTLDTRITASNMVKIISQCMKIVQTFTKLNGVEKKDLVIDVVQKLIRDSDHDEVLEDVLIDMLEKIGHPVIDTIIVASKGKFFSNMKRGIMKWMKECCCC
jgi:hypothetical protein